ncbi:YgfZ/GcvT domain-containing protein [Corynebacterium kutscheri]|uniref:Folate-binding protein YgfZ n=1 Tax=Corynebacterium kutscheri TaxID=35755 RepID=A0A0F6TCK9_9CORY|nr:folate-binding protein [Corynebacterium kutscheri]AKE40794.1 folate-binding protein YgfZ [Corynebacterium kutscheri]VEH09091.1 predicted aminomethyltransferase related to GcvT [Corynebacterium kutscheri]
MTISSYQSPLLQLPQAAEYQDEVAINAYQGVAWHYGSPLTEQRAFHTTGGLIDRSNRPVIKVSGPDAASFLHNLLSQKLDDAPPGLSAQALDLDSQGRIVHLIDLTVTEEEFFIDVAPGYGESLQKYLTMMVFWSDVSIDTPDLRILSVIGAKELVIPEEVVLSRQLSQRLDLFIPTNQLLIVAKKLIHQGIQPAGLMAYTAQRVQQLAPEIELDLDDKSIPHEIPALISREGRLGAVHLHKGCYRGQETVARVENLGRSPRVLVMVHIDGSAPSTPKVGEEITTIHKRRVGRLGTVVHDLDYGPIGLALIKRSALEQPSLLVGGVDISIDKDSLPVEDHEQLGKKAIEKLRGK